jgi:hypothetical protein
VFLDWKNLTKQLNLSEKIKIFKNINAMFWKDKTMG